MLTNDQVEKPHKRNYFRFETIKYTLNNTVYLLFVFLYFFFKLNYVYSELKAQSV